MVELNINSLNKNIIEYYAMLDQKKKKKEYYAMNKLN